MVPLLQQRRPPERVARSRRSTRRRIRRSRKRIRGSRRRKDRPGKGAGVPQAAAAPWTTVTTAETETIDAAGIGNIPRAREVPIFSNVVFSPCGHDKEIVGIVGVKGCCIASCTCTHVDTGFAALHAIAEELTRCDTMCCDRFARMHGESCSVAVVYPCLCVPVCLPRKTG